MPTNLYGPNDNFDPDSSHVLPAMIRKIHDAKAARQPTVTLWGTGTPLREFMHADDLADAAVFLLETYDQPECVNVGTGEEVTIAELARMVKDIVGYGGKIVFDAAKPNGTPRKLLDVGTLSALGWRSKVALREGLVKTYSSFLVNGPVPS